MSPSLKYLATQALARPPFWPLLRRRALRGDPLTILCYHTLGPDTGGPDAWTVLRMADFQRQVAILRAHYDIVSLNEALEPRASRKGRPRAVLTFDDGEAGMHRHLLPFVQRENLPVTVYVATGQIVAGRPFWFDRVMNACQVDRPQVLDLGDEGLGYWQFPGGDGAGRWQVLGPLLEALKEIPPSRREAIVDRIETSLPPAPPERRLAPMTLLQLAELADCPLITIGAHSDCHNLLDQIPIDEARDSICRSRDLLQGWTGREVVHFAYPNGNSNTAIQRATEEAGFRSATILGMALAHAGDSRFALPRLAIGRYDSPARFKLRLARI
ncbi:MAG: polysaccharide deacetylase family protein [Pseudorhodobacter sp.]